MKRRQSYKRILILCEGFTEEIYAKSLRSGLLSRELQRTVNIEIVRHKKNDPLNLVTAAKLKVSQAKKESAPYDDIWLFFDHDNSPHLSKAFSEAEKYGFRLAFTAISLEYWFILHFEDCGKMFSDAEDCLRHLLKLWPIYHKTKLNHFEHLTGYMDLAIERAERRDRRNIGVDLIHQQPYTSVHKLIEYFRSLERNKK